MTAKPAIVLAGPDGHIAARGPEDAGEAQNDYVRRITALPAR